MKGRTELPTPDDSFPQMVRTRELTQKHLDECRRALGRDLWDFEVRILDYILVAQAQVNYTLLKRGQATRMHSLDQAVAVFIERVDKMQTNKIAERQLKMARRDGRL